MLAKRKRKSTTLCDFLDMYPIAMNRAFSLARVHRTTWARWLDGDSEPPAAIMELLRLHATGEPPSVDHEWQGWCFTQGKLFTPSNRGFEPSDILQLPDLYRDRHMLQNIQQNFALQSKLF